jgi:hypothetical protein
MEFECFTLVFLSIANCMTFFQTNNFDLHNRNVVLGARLQKRGTANHIPNLDHAGAALGLFYTLPSQSMPGTGQSRVSMTSHKTCSGYTLNVDPQHLDLELFWSSQTTASCGLY